MAIAFDASLGGTAFTTGTSTTAAHTTTAAAASGSRIIVCVGYFGSVTVSSVSGGGLTWVKDEEDTTGHNARGAVFSADAPSGLASGTTITATYSATADSRWISAQSFTGIATGASGYLTGTPPAALSAFGGTTFTLPSITPADANALIFGLISLDGVTADVVSWTSTGANEIQTIFNATTTEGASTGYRIVSSIAAYALAGTFSVAPGEQGYNSVAYKAAAGAAVSPPSPQFRPLLPTLSKFSPLRGPFFPVPVPTTGTVAGPLTFTQPLTATTASTAAITNGVGKSLTATVAASASAAKQTAKALTATVAVIATLIALRVFLRTLTATVAVSASITRQAGKLLTTTVAVSATLTKQVGKTLSASVAVAATMLAIKVILRTLTATVAVSSTMVRQIAKPLSASVAVAASVVKSVGKPVKATVATSATMTALRVFLRTLTATVATSATLTSIRAFFRVLQASVGVAASVTRRIAKGISTTVGAIASFIATFISGSAPPPVDDVLLVRYLEAQRLRQMDGGAVHFSDSDTQIERHE